MRRIGGVILLITLVMAVMFFRQAIGLYVDWLWFQDVGYGHVFTTILTYKSALGGISGSLFALLIYVNLKIASSMPTGFHYSGADNIIELPAPELIDPMFKRLLLPGALLVGIMASPQGAASWEQASLFFNAVPFNLQDPQFGQDVGFYVFRLPLLRVIYHWAIFAIGLSIVACAAVYLVYRGIEYTARGLLLGARARNHLLVLFGLLLIAKAAGYYLDAFDLLHSSRGVSHGASYADVYGNLPALRILTFLALIAAALCFAQIYRAGYKFVILGVGALVGVHLLGLNAYPTLLQRFRVTPNEIEAERPFIERTIKFTRFAFGLDKITTKDFPADEQLTAADLKRNESTISNIRLWDHRPLLTTYAQLQEIRPYYKFVDVDNDRYMIDGTYRQVMLSARELSHQHLQSRNWINEHLTFTHGHGVVFGPVNQVTSSGQPEFFIKDIPPVATTSLKISRPEIYYGELANDYVLVQTKSQELDYPAGDQNIYTTYKGQRGVAIGSLWRRLVFSAHHASLRILLAQDLNAESRILYYRQIQERVKKIAPFIIFDRDAYVVVAQGGRLFWIVDGYTVSDRFPYSEPLRQQGTNYIRNSVKAVVDAYQGTVEFYTSDTQDPVIQSFAKTFPNLMKPLETMPEDLRAHIRYPQDLFSIQARVYTTYHMQDPQVFYNKEDLLSIPRQNDEGRERDVEPYYTIMRLPGETKEEFVLLLPFTPNKRDNMRSWLAARSDAPHYGKLIALDFPKAKLVYGPKQIDARIDQDTTISQQLSLWNQRGSQVIRGSLLSIPIDRSLLYVQPLYLAAEKGSLPELKRVIVAFGNRIAMEETLEQSLQRVFGAAPAKEAAQPVVAAAPQAAAKSEQTPARQALDHFQRAQENLKQGNWAGYGDEMKKIEALLKEMQKGR
ncbi:MAG: UPF0182 family protein [Deltaproteobacteria bacterium]|nr:UPF0182 family protein [Deltaproteobacteria bacterium]